MVGVKRRNIALSIIFSFITCGLYIIYWTYAISNESRMLVGDYEGSAGLDIVLDIVTCGIYGFVIVYQSAKRIYNFELERNNGRASDDSVVVVVLYIFMGIASLAILQSKLNAYADDYQ